MIQRIQSIFLLLAGGASFGLFKLPFAHTDEAVVDSALFADTAYNIQDNSALLGVFVACGVVLVLTIFLFNNRKLQMNLTKLGLLLALVGVGLTAFYLYQDAAMKVAELSAGVAMPIVTVIFAILAHVYINKDEKLVKSVDRLR